MTELIRPEVTRLFIWNVQSQKVVDKTKKWFLTC